MLNENGFNNWAEQYDESVTESKNEEVYPFAGYDAVLGFIEAAVMSKNGHDVLDIGFGTATLTKKLYDKGCNIYGQDFSDKMISIAQEKMPNATLCQGDMGEGIVPELSCHQYDSIIATYSIHHLSDEEKVVFIKSLHGMLKDGGSIYLGDVSFENRDLLEKCKAEAGDCWDDDEIYVVYDELKTSFSKSSFHKMSYCAGVTVIE